VACGGVHIDVVDSDAGAPHDAQLLGLLKQSRGYFRGAAHDQGIGISNFAGQFGGGWRNDLPAGIAKERSSALADFVCNNNFHGQVRVSGGARSVNRLACRCEEAKRGLVLFFFGEKG
jgi:hypothetical protein